jgi:hypothetical protein
MRTGGGFSLRLARLFGVARLTRVPSRCALSLTARALPSSTTSSIDTVRTSVPADGAPIHHPTSAARATTNNCPWKFTKIFDGCGSAIRDFFGGKCPCGGRHSTGSPVEKIGGAGAPTDCAAETSSRPDPKWPRPESPGGGAWLTHDYQRSGLSFPINWFIGTGPGLYPTVERDRIDDLHRRRRRLRRLPSASTAFPLSICWVTSFCTRSMRADAP